MPIHKNFISRTQPRTYLAIKALCRFYYSKKIKIFLTSILCLFLMKPIPLSGQMYIDASANLPNFATTRQSMDVNAGDLDGDGDLDIALANEFQSNIILINDGTGVFSNGTSGNLPQENHDSEDVIFADLDGDGDLDLVFCSEDDVNLNISNVHELYLNDGTASFSIGFQLPDSEANAIISADLNNDSFPDLLLGNAGQNFVLINNQDGTFNDVTQTVLPSNNNTTQDLNLSDVDGDGDLDLFEGNEDGNRLHINNGNGLFLDESTQRLPQGLNIETRKVSFGDMDNDGDLDIFLSNVAFIPGKNRQNRLFENDGQGFFTDVTATHLPVDTDHTIDAVFEDVDLDGDLDIVVANVFGGPLKLYANDGTGHFSDQTMEVFGQMYFRDALGVIAADLNGDDIKDLYVCDRNTGTNNKDILLLHSPVNAMNELEQLAENIKIFPNPNNGFFEIEWTAAKVETFQLLDTTGRLVASPKAKNLGNDRFQFDLKKIGIDKGVYFLKMEADGVARYAKVIVE